MFSIPAHMHSQSTRLLLVGADLVGNNKCLLAHTSSKGEKLGTLRVEKLTLFTHERALFEMIQCNLKVILLLSVLGISYECNHSGKDTTRWH